MVTNDTYCVMAKKRGDVKKQVCPGSTGPKAEAERFAKRMRKQSGSDYTYSVVKGKSRIKELPKKGSITRTQARKAASTVISNRKKTLKDERDTMGFRKKDYPIIGIVALLVLNVWAFNVNTGTIIGRLIAGGVDSLVAFWLYKRYWPKFTGKGKVPAKKTIGSKRASGAQTAKDNELGLFGIKKKHYPVLGIAVAAIVTFSAIFKGSMPMIMAAVVLDLALVYWAYNKYWRKR